MTQQINLFNPVFLKQKKYFSLVPMLQALGLIVLGSALFYGYAAYQVKLLTKQSDDTAARYAAEQTRLAGQLVEHDCALSDEAKGERAEKLSPVGLGSLIHLTSVCDPECGIPCGPVAGRAVAR